MSKPLSNNEDCLTGVIPLAELNNADVNNLLTEYKTLNYTGISNHLVMALNGNIKVKTAKKNLFSIQSYKTVPYKTNLKAGHQDYYTFSDGDFIVCHITFYFKVADTHTHTHLNIFFL